MVGLQDYILRSIDQRKGVILLLLDLSAAFDTVDHNILLSTLENDVGIKGQCLQWLASYLQYRQQAVLIDGDQSPSHTLTCGVPQGSVLGPLLFTVYTSPLAALLREHGILFHLYADDTQLFLESTVSDALSVQDAIRAMETWVALVRSWMSKNMLKLNDDKTEFLVIRPRSMEPYTLPITIGDTTIAPSDCARNLGVIF